MGDVRFSHVYDRLRSTDDLPTLLRELPDLQVIEALAAASRQAEPYLANVLATEALNRTRRCSAIVEFLREGLVVLDKQGRVVLLNPEGERLLGRRQAEAQGQDFHELVHHQHAHAAASSGSAEDALEPIPREDCDLLRALQTTGKIAVENHDVFVRPGGDTFLAGFTSGVIERDGEAEGLVVVFRDLTERMRAEDRLLMFRAVTERAPQAIFWVEKNGRVAYGNRMARMWLGYDEREITDLKVFDIDVQMEPSGWPAHWQRVKDQGEATLESVHRDRRGQTFPVRMQVCHVEEPGAEYHCAFVTRV